MDACRRSCNADLRFFFSDAGQRERSGDWRGGGRRWRGACRRARRRCGRRCGRRGHRQLDVQPPSLLSSRLLPLSPPLLPSVLSPPSWAGVEPIPSPPGEGIGLGWRKTIFQLNEMAALSKRELREALCGDDLVADASGFERAPSSELR